MMGNITGNSRKNSPLEQKNITNDGEFPIIYYDIWKVNDRFEFGGGIMKQDCGFVKENNWFRYRAGGILIHDDKMLFVKSAIGDYYYMIGGGVHLGETSEKCIEREILEEVGIRANAERLAVVCENFFKGIGGKIDGFDCHTIEFYYNMKIVDDDLTLCKSRTDDGENLVWVPVENIEQSKIKPEFIKDNIKEIINGNHTIHIIEERDR